MFSSKKLKNLFWLIALLPLLMGQGGITPGRGSSGGTATLPADAVFTGSVTAPYGAFGTNPAQSGVVRTPNAGWIVGRNNGNTADLNMIRIAGSDSIEFGTQVASSNNIVSSTTIAGTNGVSTGATGYFSFATRTSVRSPANGLWNFTNNAETAAMVQINNGTAAPTVTTCGTGTLTAHSTNTSGQITATGATVCTLTFGAPAWSFTPFCTVTEVTAARALFISAASTTAITVSGLTAADVFNYICVGGGI